MMPGITKTKNKKQENFDSDLHRRRGARFGGRHDAMAATATGGLIHKYFCHIRMS
jgi:hypothetical protein